VARNIEWIMSKRISRLLCYLLIAIAVPTCYLVWKSHAANTLYFGFIPPKMALAEFKEKDVIGDLGGMKVRIPRSCAEFVEYDGDPGFGERRKGRVPDRTFDSKLKSFGIDARFPEMICKENAALREDSRLRRQDKPWVSIGINSGEIYPRLGASAISYRESLIVESIIKPSEFWFDNYEKLPGSEFGLDAYVVAGFDPNLGGLARASERTKDVFIGRNKSGIADTYISCGRTYVSGGVASCSMDFSLEPKAKIFFDVKFVRSRLSQWGDIKRSAIDLIISFEVGEGGS
jgi:hypothetical protein